MSERLCQVVWTRNGLFKALKDTNFLLPHSEIMAWYSRHSVAPSLKFDPAAVVLFKYVEECRVVISFSGEGSLLWKDGSVV